MKRTPTSAGQLLFLAVLSALPLAIIWADGLLRQGFVLEQQRQDWEQDVARLFEGFRSGMTLEGQYATMVERFRRRFQQITEPAWELTASELTARFRAAFPPSHRPASTLLYGFKPHPRGEGFVPLIGPGLESRGARVLAELTGWILCPPERRPPASSSLIKRYQAIFGQQMPLDLLAEGRLGRLTPGLFFGQEVIFLWDALTGAHGQVLGAFLAVFPFELTMGDLALRHALQRAHRQHPGMVPVLIPLAGESRQRPILFPRGYRPSRRFVRLVERIARSRDRDRIALPAQVSGFLPGHWAIRRFPAADVPYELWVFRRLPRRLPPETTAAMQLWVLIGGGLWLVPLLRHLTTSAGFALTMRQWVMTCMVSLAVLAMAALRFAGVYYLETSTVRQARERIAQARAALEAIDTGVSNIFEHFGRICRHLAYDPQWVDALFSFDPAQTAGAFTTARAHLSRQHPRLPLNYLLRFRADAEMRGEVLAATDHDRRTGQAVLLILRPFMQGAAGLLASAPSFHGASETCTIASFPCTDNHRSAATPVEARGQIAARDHHDATPEALPPSTGTPATERTTPTASPRSLLIVPQQATATSPRRMTETLFADFLRSSLHSIAFRRFLRLRQQAALMPSIRRPLLQYYDFLATGKRLSGALVFLSDAATAYRRYLQLAMPGLALSRQGWYATGERTAEGCRLLPPGLGAAERSRFGRRLERLMQVAARAGSTQEERVGGFSLLAMPCLHAQGFVLGAAIPLDDLEVWRSHRGRQLSIALLSFLGLVLWLGWATASHLLDPLREVEHGLRQVARGNLDLAMTLDRDDELGDLSATFDRLLQGLRERRELGRFVSGQVDALVAARDHAAVLRPQRRVTTVLASDLREFTTLSERHPPETIVAMLNRHHQEMVEAILAHQGSVELFIGDAVIAVFHDLEGEDGPRRAVAAAREMRRRHRRILAERTTAGLFPYGMGVGIDRGEVLIGTFGREGKLEHTLLGPPRQRAEALEAASKRGRHTLIVVSPAVARACPELACVPITSEALEILEEETG